jgi:hypothetical protein
MPPNITAPKIQLYHALHSTTKHQKKHKNKYSPLDLSPTIAPLRPLAVSPLSPSCGLLLCA